MTSKGVRRDVVDPDKVIWVDTMFLFSYISGLGLELNQLVGVA